MKYGLLANVPTKNFGDEIQTYAIKQFLPHVDYIVDRESIDTFRSERGNEPVAVIMAAWWMWRKWNWPPAECIIPYFVSMHLNHYGIEEKGSPICDEWMQGIGQEYFKAYGPVGVRDMTSIEYLERNDIDAYFSGCVTLTLPKQRETADKGSYVVIVDLRPELRKKVEEWLKDSGLEVRVVTHNIKDNKANMALSMEERMKNVEKRLTLYQNARFVITRRLHVTLPCLAMEVPVISIVKTEGYADVSRWTPYYEWTNFVSEQDVLEGKIDYDYDNPPANKSTYKKTREALIDGIQGFIREMESKGDAPLSELKKTTYTQEEARQWQMNLMKDTLWRWRMKTIKLTKKKVKQEEKNAELRAKIRELEKNEKKLKKKIRQLEQREPSFQEMRALFKKKVRRRLKKK